MATRQFISFAREKFRKSSTNRPYRCISWIESPLDESDPDESCLYRHSDATPIELFFDLFFVANLSTFTATNEMQGLEALSSYVGFLGILWFTWLQVTLFDIRFARDSVFERTCKAVQLATMVGFASAGSGFATQVRPDNLWIFHSFSVLLAISRALLSVQYSVTAIYLRRAMPDASKRLGFTGLFLLCVAAIYVALYFVFDSYAYSGGSHVWISWWFLFAIESLYVMWVSSLNTEICFEETHLNVRMSLLTLIIVGDGVISITRIVNRTVGGGGWTRWSFVHILGVTIAVYLLWQSYYDISPREKLGCIKQQIWALLHFPFHVLLILLSEGSQILALTLDISLKLRDLEHTILLACKEPRMNPTRAINLLNSTILDMEIDYSHGVLAEQSAIQQILQSLRDNMPLCSTGDIAGSLDMQRSHDLMANATVSLFASMRIRPPIEDFGSVESGQLLMMYLKLLGFVFIYYITVASLLMFMFGVFVFLGQKKVSNTYMYFMIAIRFTLGIVLLSLISLIADFQRTYAFMTSPMVLFVFTFALLIALLGDRLWEWVEVRRSRGGEFMDNPSGLMVSMAHVTPVTSGSRESESKIEPWNLGVVPAGDVYQHR